jgi:hypothetical protein
MAGAQQELGQFLLTQVMPCLQSGDHYQAHFKAVSGDINLIPTSILQAPPAQPQLAVVRKNDDASGESRIRVHFPSIQADCITACSHEREN